MKKKKDINELTNNLLILYNYYESYCWNHSEENPKIKIYNGNLRYKIDFLINNNEEDSFELSFDQEERKLYEYVSIKMLVDLFKNVQITMKDNNIYNKAHKDYLNLKLDDDKLKEEIRAIIVLLNGHHLDDVNEIINTKYYNLKRKRKINEDFITLTKDRVNITKKLVRRVKE